MRGWLEVSVGEKLQELSAGKDVLEIGSYCGKSAVIMAQSAKSVLCIDTFKAMDNGQIQSKDFTTLDEFLENTKQYVNIKHIVGASPWAFKEIKKGTSFDFAFIDGMHDYSSVYDDTLALWPFLRDNSIIAYHDSHLGEVALALSEIYRNRAGFVEIDEKFNALTWFNKTEGNPYGKKNDWYRNKR